MISTPKDLVSLLFYKGYTQESYELFNKEMCCCTIDYFIQQQNNQIIEHKVINHSSEDVFIATCNLEHIAKEIAAQARLYQENNTPVNLNNIKPLITYLQFTCQYLQFCNDLDLVTIKVENSEDITIEELLNI